MIMTIHFRNGTQIEILVSDKCEIASDRSTGDLISISYPDQEGEHNGLRYIRVDDVIAVFVK